MALEAGQKLRQFSGYASGSLLPHHRMHSESVVGRHNIHILPGESVTLIMHAHLPNCSKHALHKSLRHKVNPLDSPLASCVGHVLGPDLSQTPTRQSLKDFLCSSLEPRSPASASLSFPPSAIEDCLHRLKSRIPPSPPFTVLMRIRRAAPVRKRHRIGI